LTSVDSPDFVPGGAKYFDLPGLLSLCAPGEVWVKDDASSNERPKVALASYEAAGAAKQLTWYTGEDFGAEAAAIDWLLKK